ncbi:MAG: hypothetical protein ACREP9_04515 [Candidatus Dormibacteraceae bacterium]
MLFGRISQEILEPSPLGKIVKREWQKLPKLRPEIKLDMFVIMPNHLHGIIWLNPTSTEPTLTPPNNVGARLTSPDKNKSQPFNWTLDLENPKCEK